jgi:hypothetical protein
LWLGSGVRGYGWLQGLLVKSLLLELTRVSDGPSDTELLLDFKNGNTDAMARLYTRYSSLFFQMAVDYQLSAEDAENILGETFSEIISSIQHQDMQDGRSWIIDIYSRKVKESLDILYGSGTANQNSRQQQAYKVPIYAEDSLEESVQKCLDDVKAATKRAVKKHLRNYKTGDVDTKSHPIYHLIKSRVERKEGQRPESLMAEAEPQIHLSPQDKRNKEAEELQRRVIELEATVAKCRMLLAKNGLSLPNDNDLTAKDEKELVEDLTSKGVAIHSVEKGVYEGMLYSTPREIANSDFTNYTETQIVRLGAKYGALRIGRQWIYPLSALQRIREKEAKRLSGEEALGRIPGLRRSEGGWTAPGAHSLPD